MLNTLGVHKIPCCGQQAALNPDALQPGQCLGEGQVWRARYVCQVHEADWQTNKRHWHFDTQHVIRNTCSVYSYLIS